jgi:amino acid permease
MALAVSFVTFLTSVWGEGIVFTWLLNLTGISALLVWGSIGVISLRFRMAYRAQKCSLLDLPYTQPFFPLLPIGVVILATLMFIAEGYSAVKKEPFEAKVYVTSLWSSIFLPSHGAHCRMSLQHTLVSPSTLCYTLATPCMSDLYLEFDSISCHWTRLTWIVMLFGNLAKVLRS